MADPLLEILGPHDAHRGRFGRAFLDVLVGYDSEDPLTALGVGNAPESYMKFLDRNGLRCARLGIIRESIGYDSEPDSENFRKITEVFDKTIGELKAAGDVVIDPIAIPNSRGACSVLPNSSYRG